MSISQEFLELLACPQCKGDLKLARDEAGLICENCRLLYEIRENIPVLLIEEARPLTDSA